MRVILITSLLLNETDIDGEPRVVDGRVDIGADEFNDQIPVIGAIPKQCYFEAYEGGSNLEPQILSIRNKGSETLNWEVTEDCNWLSVDPNAGSSTGEIDAVTISVDVSSLTQGEYNSEIVISDPCASNSPQITRVNLIIVGPIIGLSTNHVEFSAVRDSVDPNDQILSITNTGGGTLNWQIEEDCSWLEVNPHAGSCYRGESGEVALSVDISGLPIGLYDCNLTISDPNAENSPQTVSVNLVVDLPLIELSAEEFEFVALEGGANPDVQILGISNVGVGTLNWTITYDCSWLEVIPASGESAGEVDDVNIIVDVSGLAADNYSCELTISDPVAENSPQVVGINLFVIDGNDELIVPLEYETIQAAINAANLGDTVIVAPGTYTGVGNRDLDFGGKAITVRSIDPEDPCVVVATIIDCQGSSSDPHRGFYFHSGEDANSVVAGLTIKGGCVFQAHGGGICCSGSSPTMQNCIITNNVVLNEGHGGGIYCGGSSSAIIKNCIITNNSGRVIYASNRHSYGGGVFCGTGSSPLVIDSTISDNTAAGGDGEDFYLRGSIGNGGGIYCASGSDPIIINCEISNNRATGGNGETFRGVVEKGGYAYGGAVYCGSDCSITLENCRIFGNEALGGGGGNVSSPEGSGAPGGDSYAGAFYIDSDSIAIVKNCIISNNEAVGGNGGAGMAEGFGGGKGGNAFGGGIYSGSYAELTIENCCLSGNAGTGGTGGYGGGSGARSGDGGNVYGGMYYNYLSSATIGNCSIVDNTAYGGAAGAAGRNSVPGSDGLGYGAGIYGDPYTAVIKNCIIWGNDPDSMHGLGLLSYTDIEGGYSGTGNINADPCFVIGPLGDYYLSQIAAGQTSDSPCVDAGSDTAGNLGMDTLTTRTDHVIDTGIVDMGYHYLFSRTTCSADINGDGYVDFVDYALFAADFGLESRIIPRGTVVVDGSLDEWSDNIKWIDLDKIYYGNPDDVNEAKFALQWDPNTNKIYAAVIVDDIDHVFQDGYVAWDASDRLEIYSQGDAAGGTGWYGIYDTAQHYMAGPNTAGGCWATWALGQTLIGDEGLECAVVVDGNQIIYEIGVTQFDNYGGFSGGDTIVTDLETGHVVRFDVVADTRWQDGFSMLSENMMAGKYLDAGQFARYILVEDLDTPICYDFDLLSDLNVDCVIDFADLAILVEGWLDCYVGAAHNPNPPDSSINVDPNIVLGWTPGGYAVSHDVYFGTDFDDVNEATPGSDEYMGNQSGTSWDTSNYDPYGLELYTTYYWRIDEIGASCTAKGDIWGFTTWDEPNAYIVGWWKFDEGEDDIAYDSAGNNHGTIYGATWTTGQIDDALDFDGDDDYVEVANDQSQQIATNQITLSAWIKLDADVGGTQRGIINKQQAHGIAWGFEMFGDGYGGSSGNQLVFHDSDGGSAWYNCVSPTDLNLSQWYHVAVTDNAGAIEIYIDGQPDWSSGDGYGIPSNINAPIIMGTGSPSSFFFNGTIDDVRFYNRALSAGEIWQLYQQGLQ